MGIGDNQPNSFVPVGYAGSSQCVKKLFFFHRANHDVGPSSSPRCSFYR